MRVQNQLLLSAYYATKKPSTPKKEMNPHWLKSGVPLNFDPLAVITMDLRFISNNKYKIQEVKAALAPMGVNVIALLRKLHELQTENVEDLVRDKVLKAFRQTGRPVFVKHTGLYIDGLNGLPGGLTQIFWDNLQADAFIKLVHDLRTNKITVETIIGYCDSKNVFFFKGQARGTAPKSPRGNKDFQWDCVFFLKAITRHLPN